MPTTSKAAWTLLRTRTATTSTRTFTRWISRTGLILPHSIRCVCRSLAIFSGFLSPVRGILRCPVNVLLFLSLFKFIKTIFFSDGHSNQLHQRTTITLFDQAEQPPRKTGWQCRHRVPNLWRSQRISTKAISHALCSSPNPIHMAKLILTLLSLTNSDRILINSSRRHYVLTGRFFLDWINPESL